MKMPEPHQKTPEPQDSELHQDCERLLEALGDTIKYFEKLKVDQKLVHSFRRLLRYLRTQPRERLHEMIGDRPRPAGKESAAKAPVLSEDEIRAMPLDTVLANASDPALSRKDLERIASVRFGFSTGALSALRSRDALVSKLRTRVANERAHESISRLASQSGANS